jgi:glycosyltransferase involved in cell wall biosynthesis
MASVRLSIGLPVLNGAAHLREALHSVLDQTFSDFELIISDNASTDGTEEICRDVASSDQRVRYIRQPKNLGASANFNFAMNAATGYYFKWFAHDDVLAPTYFEKCLRVLDDSPTAAIVFPRRTYIDFHGKPAQPFVPDPIDSLDGISFKQLVQLPGGIFPRIVFGVARTSDWRRTRGFRPCNAADLALVAEMRLIGEFREISETLFFQRIHHGSPEQIMRGNRRGEAEWFDPANAKRKIQLSSLRLLKEHFAGIHHANLPVRQRYAAYLAMTHYIKARAMRALRRRGK